ncbi:sigma-54-dependent Fis family transcriptional regulator [Methyloradius palustris]|uniref:Sigma-54-dependent Fis family transcriptional regulator n=1 Tax=Methyloradius palustris TaxID=2778876 RepID=A0A8D5G3Z6_9PROT|nr:sigma-54-dependent Fis family transcriptional regulator [Methyloradius palustris]BCM25335.1 sigma-54-dependent Fis family transcriptional regulator [Methyloradius palustris]
MPNSVIDKSQIIRDARETFLSGGKLQKGIVAEEIIRSWERSLANGIDATANSRSQVLTVAELKQRREQHHQLLAYAQPEMATLNEQIAHTRSMVILTDDEGVILHSLGDNHFLTDPQKIALSAGASWHENERGTNAIGTALMEAAPMTVQGAEHFIERNHILSCSAVPIFGIRNELLGTLDVSNDFLIPQQHTLALVKMAAQMIENRLFSASCQGDIALHFHARPEFIGTLWEGIAVFNGDGRLLAINRSGQFQLGFDSELMKNRAVYFQDIFEPTLNSLSSGHLVFPIKLSNGARLYARADSSQSKVSAQPLPVTNNKPAKRDCAANLEMLNTGDSRLAKAISQVQRVLDQDIAILIEGETGVGKELFARAIHEASSRQDGPWVAVNCAALPEGLIESELFGYEEGAFTGARRKGSAGKLEQANGGTLFLDEIGDMPLALQSRLLRVLQERSVTPLGSSKSKPLDFMLISATNQKLRENVEKGVFRRDLYYRLNGLNVSLPALRERSDLGALISLIMEIEQASKANISPSIMSLFRQHPWPGNIRQLHNVLKTALALSGGETINESHLSDDFLEEMSQINTSEPQASMSALNSELVRTTLHKHAGNVSAAARELGISRNTFYRKMNDQ